jgi:lipopolysaccharide export system permease protein
MRILDRYVVREFIAPLAMCIAAFIIIVLSGQLFMLVDFIVQRDVPVLAVVRMLAYSLPGIVLDAGPIAVLFAVMLCLGRLAKDSELSTIRAAGVAFARLILPLLALATVASGGLYLLSENIVPWANHQSQRILREIVYGESMPAVEQDIFFRAPGERFFYVGHVNRDAGVIERVMIYETEAAPFPRLLTAAKGRIDEGTWVLENGRIHELDRLGRVTMVIAFDELNVDMDSTMQGFSSSQKEASEMTRAELKQTIDLFQRSGTRVSGLEVHYHVRGAQPLAALVLAMVGAPLITKSPRSAGGYFGVIAASLLALGYYVISAVSKSIGVEGILPPLVAAWLPNIALASVGAVLIARVDGLRRPRRGRRRPAPPTPPTPPTPPSAMALLLVAMLLLGLAVPVSAQAAGGKPFHVTAEQIVYDGESGLWTASGGVQVSFDDTVIKADRAEIDVKAKTALFVGAVVITEGQEELAGESAEVNIDTGDVTVGGARAKLKLDQVEGFLYVAGTELSREGDVLHLEDASVTSCELEKPHYRLSVESLDLYVDDRVVLYGVSYYEGSLRLLRLPKLTIPLKEGEGLSMPKVGWSALEGWYVRTETNYTVSPESRGKIRLDYFQLLGPGLGIDHTYAPGNYNLNLSAYELFNRSTASVDTSLKLAIDGEIRDGPSAAASYAYRDYVQAGTPSEDNTYTLSFKSSGDHASTSMTLSHKDVDSVTDSQLTTASLKHSSTLGGIIKLVADGSYRLNRVNDVVKQNVINLRASASTSVGNLSYTALLQEQVYIDEDGDDEDDEEAQPPPWRSLRRAPELTASLSPLRLGAAPLTVGGKVLFGVYKEDAIRSGIRQEIVSAKSEAELSLAVLTLTPAPWLSLNASVTGRAAIYSYASAGRAGATFSAGAKLTPAERLSLDVRYTGSIVAGESPFRFDTMTDSSVVSASLVSTLGPARVSLGSSYDMMTGLFGAVTASASASPRPGISLEATGKFYPASTSHNTATFKVSASPKPEINVKAGATYDFTASRLSRLETSADLRLSPDWLLQWAAVYDVVKGGFTRGNVGVTRDLHCREVSLMYDHTTGRVWLEFRLKALPGMPLGFGLGEDGIIFTN